jgi:hypothetical protein
MINIEIRLIRSRIISKECKYEKDETDRIGGRIMVHFFNLFGSVIDGSVR